jgi:hypothetical protein
MLTKFETKSNRVKGLAFHPKRFVSQHHSHSADACEISLKSLPVQAMDPGVTAQRCHPGAVKKLKGCTLFVSLCMMQR